MIFAAIPVLLKLWSFRKPVIIGLAALAVLAYVAILHFQIRSARADAVDARQERDAAMAEAMKWHDAANEYLEANRQSQAAFAAYKKQAQEWADLARRQIEAQTAQLKITSQIRKDIQDAPESDNRPVGPILNFTLDCLRQLQSGASACRH